MSPISRPKLKRVAILGAGGMGTVLALLFHRQGRDVRLWCRDASRADSLRASRENARHLPGSKLPDAIAITSNACDATEAADLIVVAIPSAYLRQTLAGVAERIPAGVPILSVVKGIEVATLERPSQIVREVLGDRPVAILSGPSHAEELAHGLPASVVVASADEALAVAIRDALNHEVFRVYTNPDLLGVELAGALKNVLGVAAGISDGLGFGDNAKAALLTRGLVEITRFAVALGASAETFAGLAGVGDVITTCYSPFGRNRAVGMAIGKGQTLETILAGMANVAEGVPTARGIREIARARGIDMPITEEVCRVLFEGKPPRTAVADLMGRDPKFESTS